MICKDLVYPAADLQLISLSTDVSFLAISCFV